MKRYLIKVTLTATSDNKNFAGQKQVWFYGKAWKTVNTHYYNDKGESIPHNNPVKWMVEEYGFKTKAAAAQALKAHQEMKEKYWDRKAEIVEHCC